MSVAPTATATAATTEETATEFVAGQENKEAGKTEQEMIDKLNNQADNTNAMQMQLLEIQQKSELSDLMFKSEQTQLKRLSDSAIT